MQGYILTLCNLLFLCLLSPRCILHQNHLQQILLVWHCQSILWRLQIFFDIFLSNVIFEWLFSFNSITFVYHWLDSKSCNGKIPHNSRSLFPLTRFLFTSIFSDLWHLQCGKDTGTVLDFWAPWTDTRFNTGKYVATW